MSLLDKYRRPGERSAEAAQEETEQPEIVPPPGQDGDEEAGFYAWAGDSHYEAFRKRNRPCRHLHIIPQGPVWHSAPYRYLLHIVQDGDHGTLLVIVYSFMVVKIRGRNLQTLASNILSEYCHAIRAFDAAKGETPADRNAAFIESIEVVIDKSTEGVLDKEPAAGKGRT